ncbi:MAG: serine/threonine protein phosphatase [Clostridiales bacterium]|nr:serine/threonine protein phosphatase [Clostridiales bacterium]
MKIFAISDLHLCLSGAKPMDIFGETWANYLQIIKQDWNTKVGSGDYVLMAGDMSWALKLEEAKEDLDYLSSLNGNKIIIRGNHDYWWKSISNLRKQLPPNIYPLQNDAIKIDNYIIAGSRGWTVPENNKPFGEEDKKLYAREVIRMELSLMSACKLKTDENDKIIVMIHFPPFNSVFDESEFTKLFEKYGVDKVVYGHLHGKAGRTVLTKKINNIEYFLTSCDKLNNKLIQLY